jgi:uncharacterized protein (DUF1810 family)
MAYDLDRFVSAQDPVYAQVVRELRTGRKTSHWMWYIFPQLSGLGRSDTARLYAIASLDEARAYVEHPILGPRLRECTTLVIGVEGQSLEAIFGAVDALKFCSSMTLFSQVTPTSKLFQAALDKYCGAVPDQATLDLLAGAKQDATPPRIVAPRDRNES